MKTIHYNKPFAAHGEHHLRWIEYPQDGLRFEGYADEVCRGIEHTGWYCDPEYGCESDTLRGVVYQLPARKGQPRYLAGYIDTVNDHTDALLSFDALFEEPEEAARAGDRLAEIVAEKERDYRTVWNAGQRYRELGENISAIRVTTITLIKGIKGCPFPVPHEIMTHLRAVIKRNCETIAEYREKRHDLFNDFGHLEAFNEE